MEEAVIRGILQTIESIFENIAGLELLRKGYKVCVGRAGTKKAVVRKAGETI